MCSVFKIKEHFQVDKILFIILFIKKHCWDIMVKKHYWDIMVIDSQLYPYSLKE